MKAPFVPRRLLRRGQALLLLLSFLFLLRSAWPVELDLEARLDLLSADRAFSFGRWELDALARKAALGLLAPQRFLDDEARARLVLDYLDAVGEAHRLEDAIARAYADPDITDPAAATRAQRLLLRHLRDHLRRQGMLAEAILGEQVSQVLRNGGFGLLAQILPPVSGTFTPLPYMLIVSPRDHIETVYQRALEAGLTAADQTAIEQRVETAEPDYAAYVTDIGGLAAYPAMLLESTSIDWVADVMAHEWTHHYLAPHPVGIHYMDSGEARTINETTASLMGRWAGQEVVLRFYAPLLKREKPLPDPLVRTTKGAEKASPPPFDFRAEMHHTRVIVDRLLAEGRIRDAEWYMEVRRRVFVAHGYRIRRLNQAYFAFHGAYADTPGASGEDPIGPAVRRLWARSATPHDFVRAVAPLTSRAELEALLALP